MHFRSTDRIQSGPTTRGLPGQSLRPSRVVFAGTKINELELGKVSYKVVSHPDGWSDLLAQLVNEQIASSHPVRRGRLPGPEYTYPTETDFAVIASQS